MVISIAVSSCIGNKSTPVKPIIKNDMLAAADVAKGRALFIGCTACHNIIEGQPSKGVSHERVFVGPHLFGVYNRNIASRKDFEYSESLELLNNQRWSVENLSSFLKTPQSFAPKTKMSFGGMADPQDRYDIIAYLMTLK